MAVRTQTILIRTVQALLISGAALLITAGIRSGEVMSVFRKAVFICMECIGIG